jgi:hypothetical protein
MIFLMWALTGIGLAFPILIRLIHQLHTYFNLGWICFIFSLLQSIPPASKLYSSLKPLWDFQSFSYGFRRENQENCSSGLGSVADDVKGSPESDSDGLYGGVLFWGRFSSCLAVRCCDLAGEALITASSSSELHYFTFADEYPHSFIIQYGRIE